MSKETFKEAIEKAKELLFQDPEVKEKIKDALHISGVKDFLNEFVVIWWLLKRVVFVIEQLYSEYHMISESDRIDVASELADDLITFTGWLSPLELFDGILFKALISAAVNALNDKFGHDWFATATGANVKNNL